MENTSLDFRKEIFENFEKKTHSFHNKHLYIWATAILKFYEVLFYIYCKGLFCLQKTVMLYDPMYMCKALPTLENEKEQ